MNSSDNINCSQGKYHAVICVSDGNHHGYLIKTQHSLTVTKTVGHLPGRYSSGVAQLGLQELEQLPEDKNGLPASHLLAKVGHVGLLNAARLPKVLGQRLHNQQIMA
jgi:hypothetical protein